MKKLMLMMMLALAPTLVLAQVEVGAKPPTVKMEGKDGAKVDGTAWSSDEIAGKVTTMFYVDPDEKDTNNHVSDALKKENFPKEKYGSIAMINMDATWLPNSAIESSLAEKQKEFPDTVYVKDFKKVMVSKWGLADDSSNVISFDAEGKVIFRKDGKLSEGDIKKLVKAIRTALGE